ncbi:MAG TPA: hypothetical protein VLK85_21280 [Ramlibacter sp.]|nr:hypothetical protein [Ramlibacter sp.]
MKNSHLNLQPSAAFNLRGLAPDPYLLLPAVLVLLAWLALHLVQRGTPVFPADDAYLTLHNAQVLLGQRDGNFAVPALVGATSTVHVVLVALLGLVLPLPWALDTTLWLGALLYATGVCRLAQMAGARPLPAVLFTAAAMLAGHTTLQLLNGLETGLAMGAITWALVAASTPGRRAALTLAALCGLMPFLRPELAALSALLLPLPVLRAARDSARAAAVRLLVECSVIAMLCAAPWLLLNLWNTGDLVPATASAKQAWFAEGDLSARTKLHWVGGQVLLFLLTFGAISALALAMIWGSLVGMAGAAFACAVVGAFWMNLPGGFSHYHQRYLYVFAPVLVFAAAAIFRNTPTSRHSLIGSVLLAQSTLIATPALHTLQNETDRTRRELAGVADWSLANLPADSVLLVHDAGYIAAATPFRMVDVVGRKTPSSIESHRQLTLPSRGERRTEAVASIASNSRATHLILLDEWERSFQVRAGLVARGWSVEPLRTGGAYKVHRLKAPGLVEDGTGPVQ